MNQAKGNFDGPDQAWTINDNDQLQGGAQYGPIIIAYRNGAPVRVSDVARVIDGAENTKLAAWVNTDPAIVLNIQRQPGTNIISVVDTVQALLPQIEASLPPGIGVRIISDRTTTIRASVEDVEFELILTTALVVMVIFLFLRSASATIIPGVAVPLSLVGTFAVMYLLGYSLDNLSLMALTISTGFVVDDAIVMIENITRYMEMGESAMEAALKGSAEIGFTIVSLTVSLIAVLIPLLFMADIVGRLFREFAVTLAVTIIFSAFVSLTLTPMMAARILKHKPESEQGKLYHWSEWMFVKTIEYYGRMVQVVLRHQPLTLLVALATLGLTIYLYQIVPKGFFPVQDTGAILGISQAPETVSFPAMSKLQQRLVEVVLQDPAVENLTSFIGADGVNTTMNSGRIQITLKPLEQRAGVSAVNVIRRLQPKLEQVTGIQLFLQPIQDLTVEDRISRTQYQYSLDAPDKALLDQWVPRLVDKMKQIPELRDVASDQQNNGLGLLVNIDRDTAGRLGITPQNIDDALYDSFGQRQVSTIYTQTNQFHVILEVAPQYRQDASALKDHVCADRIGIGESGLHDRARRDEHRADRRGGASARTIAVSDDRLDDSIAHYDQPSKPVSGRHALLQSGSRIIARNGGRSHQAGDARRGHAGQHRAELPGHRARVRIIARERIDPDSRGDRHGLHCAGRVVRKLHSSHHHSFDAALGGRRRDSGAGPVQYGSGCHRADRHHSADRNREEERHHDDRFRARSRAQRRQVAGGGDLPGLPAALPAHHDDHHGGAAGRGAAGLRQRRRFGTAQAARHLHHRRIAGQPGADPVHHAGHLFVLRDESPRGLGEPDLPRSTTNFIPCLR